MSEGKYAFSSKPSILPPFLLSVHIFATETGEECACVDSESVIVLPVSWMFGPRFASPSFSFGSRSLAVSLVACTAALSPFPNPLLIWPSFSAFSRLAHSLAYSLARLSLHIFRPILRKGRVPSLITPFTRLPRVGNSVPLLCRESAASHTGRAVGKVLQKRRSFSFFILWRCFFFSLVFANKSLSLIRCNTFAVLKQIDRKLQKPRLIGKKAFCLAIRPCPR